MIRRQNSAPLFAPVLAQTVALFSDEEAPRLTAADAARILAALPLNQRSTDRAHYLAARSVGAAWYCPDACTLARGDACDCPCGRSCHGAAWCGGH